jgi:LytS/YehU family sensor histidine kinase
MAKSWFLKQKANQELIKQKAKTKVQLIKAKLHPAFLFHSLDALYDDMLAGFGKSSVMLLKLSDLLSYILYDSNEESVSLEKELTIMEDYLALEKFSHAEKLNLSITNTVTAGNRTIAPMLLLPIVECVLEPCFIKSHQQVTLNLHLHMKNNQFSFILTMEPRQTSIGFKNNEAIMQVQKRVEAKYRNSHDFKISETESKLVVSLTIVLDAVDATSDLFTEEITILV